MPMREPFTLAEVQSHAKTANVVPLVFEVFAGDESPVAIFEKVASQIPGSFLLESAEHGVWSRYSFIGVKARGFLAKKNGDVFWQSPSFETPLPDGSDISNQSGLQALETIRSSWRSVEIEGLPPLTSGLVGLLGWSMITEVEPGIQVAAGEFPEMLFAMFKEAVVVDHHTGTLLVVSNIFIDDSSDVSALYAEGIDRLRRLTLELQRSHQPYLAQSEQPSASRPTANFTQATFTGMVEKAKKYVERGDVFQVVLSQRFDYSTDSDALSIYRVLRAMNPSPYMYLLNFLDADRPFAVVGSSPEALVKISNNHAVTHPIAGSRPRGNDWDEDAALELELTGDEKERSEHLMLVDLARNDLLKVCEPSSISVTEFMQVHKFSHIQHLVSTVEGDLRTSVSPVDVFRATFPAGTLSGAPKPRALEIISELESDPRGIYGGVVGYFDFVGNADLAIAIRTLVLANGVASVQAGAGIVLDSDPMSEYNETVNKASAPGRAVQSADSLKKIL